MGNIIYVVLIGLSFMEPARAATINYEAKHVDGNYWEYAFAVKNDRSSESIHEFTMYFSPSKFRNLTVKAAPLGWDAIVNEPSVGLPSNGFYDALALNQGISAGATLTGFSVGFEFLGTGLPGHQPYDIIEPMTRLTLHSGVSVSSVPLPGSLSAFMTGLILLAGILLSHSKRRLHFT
ncbi:MAG: hypothetical protein ABL933_08720 [Methyloglobulus sp.]|nr:hypothetical protein [Methyloglobulus sp.]